MFDGLEEEWGTEYFRLLVWPVLDKFVTRQICMRETEEAGCRISKGEGKYACGMMRLNKEDLCTVGEQSWRSGPLHMPVQIRRHSPSP